VTGLIGANSKVPYSLFLCVVSFPLLLFNDIVDDEQGQMRREVVIAYFKAFSRILNIMENLSQDNQLQGKIRY
jgi:hypothetical protein